MFFVASSLTQCIQYSLSWGVPSTQDTPGEPWHVCALGSVYAPPLPLVPQQLWGEFPSLTYLPKLVLYVYSKLNRDTKKRKKGFSCVYSLVGMGTCCMYEFPGSVSSSRKRKRLVRILPLPAGVVAQLVSACYTNMRTQIYCLNLMGRRRMWRHAPVTIGEPKSDLLNLTRRRWMWRRAPATVVLGK